MDPDRAGDDGQRRATTGNDAAAAGDDVAYRSRERPR
jgi:hypothetical protein